MQKGAEGQWQYCNFEVSEMAVILEKGKGGVEGTVDNEASGFVTSFPPTVKHDNLHDVRTNVIDDSTSCAQWVGSTCKPASFKMVCASIPSNANHVNWPMILHHV